jgi:hypothetical protein
MPQQNNRWELLLAADQLKGDRLRDFQRVNAAFDAVGDNQLRLMLSRVVVLPPNSPVVAMLRDARRAVATSDVLGIESVPGFEDVVSLHVVIPRRGE